MMNEHPESSAMKMPCIAWTSVCLILFGLFVGGNARGEAAAGSFAGIVSAATPEAVASGVEILESGGNAIDAAVAVSFALAVTEPAGSGLGGQAFFLVQDPGQEPFVISGTSLAPGSLPANLTRADLEGRRSSTVPSLVRLLEYAWKHHGSGRVSWGRLLQPAIRFAEEGYALGHFRYLSLLLYAHQLRTDPATAKLFLLPGGEPPQMRSLIKNPALARTLKRLTRAGASDFYKGEIAREIAADMKRHNGWISLDDLRSMPEPIKVPALKGTYRGWDVHSLPPPTGGWEVLQALNILGQAPQADLKTPTDRRYIWLAEALRITHRNRRKAPVSDLINYDREVAEKIKKQKALQLMDRVRRPGSGETTHFSIVDGKGMAVGVSQSLNSYFGAKVVNGRLGFLYNDYMSEFMLKKPTHPFALRPRGIPYSSMSATLLSRNGKPALLVGSPGSQRIISAVVQVISHWVDVGRGIEAAVSTPRLHVEPRDRLYLESRQMRIPPSLLLKMERRGYDIVRPLSSLYRGNLNPYFGGVHAVALEAAGWRGAADPRRDGTVGYAWLR
jgi:gamma-glutamyltranspeptidase/glutathione hydrolase